MISPRTVASRFVLVLALVAPFALAVVPAFVSLGCAPGADDDEGDEDRDDPTPPGDCVPATCAELAIDCGDALDGCGGVVTCGVCEDGETCGAAGANLCGVGSCTATTCEAEVAQCGLLSDNCSAVLTCGTCGDGEVCSSSYTCCTPTNSCDSEGAECGTVDDGCGNPLPCGTCPDGQNCGADGPGQCGFGECTPRSCDDLDAECGAPSDGCEGTLACGDCPAYLVCGALADHQCGAVCADDCPNGYGCDDLGVCDGGALTGVVLDVTVPNVVDVHGEVTMNGGPVALREGYEDGCVSISFVSLDGNESASTGACASGGWQYTVQLYAGRYDIVVVDGYYQETMLQNIAQTVSADRSITTSGPIDLDVDVPAFVTVHGEVSMNGGAVVLREGYEDGCVSITFTSLDGTESASTGACASGGWQYEVQLYVGHYDISVVDGYYQETMLTYLPQTVLANRNVTTGGAIDLDVDVPAFVTVHGEVSMNGAPVALRDGYEDGCVSITFTNLDGGESASTGACASGGWQYEMALYVGHYDISVVDGYYQETMLTYLPQIVLANRNVTTGGAIDLDVDVPAYVTVHGEVTMNGGPVALRDGYEDGCVSITFTNLDDGESASTGACASGGWQYEAQLYVGHYDISVVDGYYQETMLTYLPQVVRANHNVTNGNAIDLDVDVPAFVTVHGEVTMNGGAVALRDGYEDGCVSISFANLDGGESASTGACASNGWQYEVQLYVGHYDISVVDGYYQETMLQNIAQVVRANHEITNGNALDLDVDVPAYVTLRGTVKMNGGPVQLRDGYEDGCVSISLQNLEGNESASTGACASSAWAYEVQLYAGIYRAVVVDGYYQETLLTNIPQTVIERVRFE